MDTKDAFHPGALGAMLVALLGSVLLFLKRRDIH
jgi:hypothetical protein